MLMMASLLILIKTLKRIMKELIAIRKAVYKIYNKTNREILITLDHKTAQLSLISKQQISNIMNYINLIKNMKNANKTLFLSSY